MLIADILKAKGSETCRLVRQCRLASAHAVQGIQVSLTSCTLLYIPQK